MNSLSIAPEASFAWLFPGHGSQYAGMGRELLARWPAARALFDLAEDLSGLPLRHISLHGDEARLRRPEVLEPALAALSLGHASLARHLWGPPRFVAGYSAGELPALCCAGVLTEEDALRVAVLRGHHLQEAAESLDGAMLTVSGLPGSVLREGLEAMDAGDALALAGENAPRHYTVSGETTLVRKFAAWAQARGALVSHVDAAGPWHCKLMAETAARIRDGLRDIPFSVPRVPVYVSVKGDAEDTREHLRESLALQLREPVRWHSILTRLLPRTHQLVEVGPGHVLTGFVRRVTGTSRRHELHAVERSGGRLGARMHRSMNAHSRLETGPTHEEEQVR